MFVNHEVVLYPVKGEVNLKITFGDRLTEKAIMEERGFFLEPSTKVNFSINLKHILQAIEKNGYYTAINGSKINKKDIEYLTITGNKAPLTWDFNEANTNEQLRFYDSDNDGIYQGTLVFNTEIKDATVKKLTHDISHYPQFSSHSRLIDALCKLALDELELLKTPDGLLKTGIDWPGVWTRDVSYSTILSLAYMVPERAKACLMKKVINGKIIQDTGTGGAWPVSTDRMVWVLAAWEIYKVTGDQEWLTTIYPIIKKSLNDDWQTIYYNDSLVHGESSFLDRREQTYPDWMTPSDIYNSYSLSTNTVHYKAWDILAEASASLNLESETYKSRALALKSAINNNFWLPEKNYYSQYIYGCNYKTTSPRSDALGEALAVLFDVADAEQKQKVLSNTPVVPYGIPCMYPQTPIPMIYQNNAVWPFVQGFWNLAAAETINEQALTHGLASIYRAGAIFLSNKEIMVASTGTDKTESNSDAQLWSVAANLGMVYRVFLGMNFYPDKLVFKPVIPQSFKGDYAVRDFPYRNSMLNIKVSGFGYNIKTFLLDGKPVKTYELSDLSDGVHTIEIQMDNKPFPESAIHLSEIIYTPSTPVLVIEKNMLVWDKQNKVKQYDLFENGKFLQSSTDTFYIMPSNTSYFKEYQVKAVGENGTESFLSNPIDFYAENNHLKLEMETYANQQKDIIVSKGNVKSLLISKKINTNIEIPITITEAGLYSFSFKYSNGNGSLTDDNKCAIRSIYIDDDYKGCIVFPQTAGWYKWSTSSLLKTRLTKGEHKFILKFDTINENMDMNINEAQIDCLYINKVGE